jgi:hypothetical protein
MMSESRRGRKLTAALVVVIVALTGMGAALAVRSRTSTDLDRTPTVQVHSLFATELADERRLVGWADDVFQAEVLTVEDAGTTIGADQRPKSVYTVRVLESIKGGLTGEIAVVQVGGLQDGQVVIYDEQPLLELGRRYFLATNRIEQGHKVVEGFGALPVDDQTEVGAVRERLRSAATDEIPYDPSEPTTAPEAGDGPTDEERGPEEEDIGDDPPGLTPP